jgi:hypothetical protein
MTCGGHWLVEKGEGLQHGLNVAGIQARSGSLNQQQVSLAGLKTYSLLLWSLVSTRLRISTSKPCFRLWHFQNGSNLGRCGSKVVLKASSGGGRLEALPDGEVDQRALDQSPPVHQPL